MFTKKLFKKTAAPFVHRPARTWLKIMIRPPEAWHEETAAYLSALTGSGVEISHDAIIGYLANDATRLAKETDLYKFLEKKKDRNPGARSIECSTELIQEEDWGSTWKRHFRTDHVSERLVIKPTWENYAPSGEEKVIELDPAMAFGTGAHASTRLVLELLDLQSRTLTLETCRVLDLGTGTGILGMAAAMLGAREVIAIDNDPDAVAAAKDNVLQNRLAGIMTVSGQDLASLTDSFNIILANITHDVLLALRPELVRLLSPGGQLILSGILKGEQAGNIVAAYCGDGLTLLQELDREEWAALCFRSDK